MSEKENALPVEVGASQYTKANADCRISKKRRIPAIFGKWLVLPVGFLIICASIGGLFLKHSAQINLMSHWVSEHALVCFLFRMGVLCIVYLLWPICVRKRAKCEDWPEAVIKRFIHRRYWIILCLLAIDIVINV